MKKVAESSELIFDQNDVQISSSQLNLEFKNQLVQTDPLRRGLYPINIKFLNWQDSKFGNYVEFKIRVKYQEGPQENNSVFNPRPDSDPVAPFEWDILKRYSNFVNLHD